MTVKKEKFLLRFAAARAKNHPGSFAVLRRLGQVGRSRPDEPQRQE
jgi:hypothetical protein